MRASVRVERGGMVRGEGGIEGEEKVRNNQSKLSLVSFLLLAPIFVTDHVTPV